MIRKILVSLSALMLTLMLGAQENRSIELNLDQALDIALSQNPTIKIANLEIERQDYVKRQTVSSLIPSLSASGTYNRAIIKSDMGGGVSFEPDNTVSAAANLSVPLFVPAVYKMMRMNDQQMLAAVESARSSRLTLVNDVKKAYYNILLARQSLEVLLTSEQTIAQTVENTRNMYHNGLASEYDLLSAEVQLSNLKPTIIQTRNSIDVAAMLFKMYLGLPTDVEVTLAGHLDDFSEQVVQASEAFSSDISHNSDLRSIDLQQNVLSEQYKALRAQRLPTLAAFGSFTLSGRDPIDFSSLMGGAAGEGGGGMVIPSQSSFFWQHPISAGLSLSVPIFAGGSKTAQEKQLKNNIAQLSLQRDYLEESLGVQARTAINQTISARETMRANELTVTQAEKAYRISLSRYNAGAGTILEVNTSELNLTQAKLNHTQSIYDYLSAQADYDKIIGKEYQTTNNNNAQ